MGWFSKNEEVPQIAPAPILPELPKKKEPEKKDLPELPAFPNTYKNENLNREVVKSATGDISSPGENEVNVDVPKDLHVTEKLPRESLIPSISSKTIPELPKHIHKAETYRAVHNPSWYTEQHESIQEIPKKTLELNIASNHNLPPKRVEPIFVRIDKFQLAQKNFEQIKEKIKEMELVLGKIKDIKLREEAELKGWTEDVEKIKSQLSEIDSGVFDQI